MLSPPQNMKPYLGHYARIMRAHSLLRVLLCFLNTKRPRARGVVPRRLPGEKCRAFCGTPGCKHLPDSPPDFRSLVVSVAPSLPSHACHSPVSSLSASSPIPCQFSASGFGTRHSCSLLHAVITILSFFPPLWSSLQWSHQWSRVVMILDGLSISYWDLSTPKECSGQPQGR